MQIRKSIFVYGFMEIRNNFANCSLVNSAAGPQSWSIGGSAEDLYSTYTIRRLNASGGPRECRRQSTYFMPTAKHPPSSLQSWSPGNGWIQSKERFCSPSPSPIWLSDSFLHRYGL